MELVLTLKISYYALGACVRRLLLLYYVLSETQKQSVNLCSDISLDQINGQVEALDELGVLDAGHKQLGHLHFQKVLGQLLDLVLVDLQLNGEDGSLLGSDLKHCGQTEEGHAVKHNELFLLESVAVGSRLWLH